MFGFSYFNETEIEITIKYIETLIKLEKEHNIIVKQAEIGVVTPYIRQVCTVSLVAEISIKCNSITSNFHRL